MKINILPALQEPDVPEMLTTDTFYSFSLYASSLASGILAMLGRFRDWVKVPGAIFLTGSMALSGCNGFKQSEVMPRVAHAGGGYLSWQYTNSHEALEFNREHFSLFEIDLMWTSDDEFVCMHDWEFTAQKIFGKQFEVPPTLAEFSALVEGNSYLKSCTMETLAQWLERNPDKRLVTDFKEDNLRGLERLAQRLDRVGDHVIPQIYYADEYARVRELGYRDIIWTLYRHPVSPEQVVVMAEQMDLYAVTMPRSMAEQGLAHQLAERGVPTYVHTINTQRELAYYRSLGVTEIYTDWVAPE